ncbi:MAG: MBL fold metallo-hydrolase, partial [Acidimicrobiia bacterium]
TSEARVLVDPGNYSSDWHQLTDLAAVLITHQHHDHIDVPNLVPVLEANPTARVIAEPAVVDMLGDRAVEKAVVGERAEIGDLGVEVVGGEHEVIHDSIPRIGNVGYVLQEGDGARIFHPGDSYATAPAAIDVLALPIAAPWANVAMTVDFANAVEPGRIIPIHDATLSQAGRPTYLRMCRTIIEDSIVLDDPAIGDPYRV